MAKNILSTTLQQLDDDDVVLARDVSTITDATPVAGDFRGLGKLIDTNEATIGLPTAAPRQVYIKNTHATAKITVKWTPTGVAKVTILVLGPGDAICFWQTVTGATYGISALYLTSDTANATYKLFIGG